ncbi:hypothetical protein ACGFMM_10460 [Streptomyces sp. NPDC048604]|uniref:hypothetical protein n=1 Tax=Streptomyces sp. NPDC048604 TaxID=3365578 RepID=UPI0037219E56
MRARGAVTTAVALSLGLALGACSGGGGGGTAPKPGATPSGKPSATATPSPSASESGTPARPPATTPPRVGITPGVGGGSAKPYRPGGAGKPGGIRKKAAAAEPQNPNTGRNPRPAPPRPIPTPEVPPPWTPGDDVVVTPPTVAAPTFTPDTVR